MLRQTIKELKWRCKQVSFEKFLEVFRVWLRLNVVWQQGDCPAGSRAGMTEGSLTELGFQRWLPVREVTGRPEARPRLRCFSEFDHLGRSLVGVNEVHHEAQFVQNSWFLSAASVSASELEWCGPLAWCQWWDEQRRRPVHTLQRSDGRLARDCSVAVVQSDEHECRDQTLGDFFTRRATDLTQSPQLKEAIADNTTDVLLHRELILKVDAEISYDRDRLDDVTSDWKC